MVDEAQASAYRRLIDIGLALSAEKNLDSLLEHILLEAKSMANADGECRWRHDIFTRREGRVEIFDCLKR